VQVAQINVGQGNDRRASYVVKMQIRRGWAVMREAEH